MMGQLFEVSGAAKRTALSFLKLFGKGREEIAMAITGFLVSIPIFCDSGFIILTPLAKAISSETRKSIVSIGIALACGLVITHTMVPPTPGPVGVAGIFEVNVGSLILGGGSCSRFPCSSARSSSRAGGQENLADSHGGGRLDA